MTLEINKIYLGDCLELMKQIPAKSVDLIITDPPYGLSYNDGKDMASQREAIFGGDTSKMKPNAIQNDDEETANKTFVAFLHEANRVLKSGGCCCCCCGGGGPKPLFARWTLWMDKEDSEY